jgi:large subunit ribosomal protein L4
MVKKVMNHNSDGTQSGQLEVDEKVFGEEPNIHVMHLALKRQLSNARAGTACAKTRSEVRGGGKKPWKQKGTGRARAGSLRSPLFAGGGVIFGPKPRDYSFSMPVKARRLALRSALSSRIDNIKVIKDFSAIKTPKTKEFVKILDSLGVSGKVLVIADTVTAEEQMRIKLSSGNIPNVKLILSSNINVKDILEANNIVITESAINEITERLKK